MYCDFLGFFWEGRGIDRAPSVKGLLQITVDASEILVLQHSTTVCHDGACSRRSMQWKQLALSRSSGRVRTVS